MSKRAAKPANMPWLTPYITVRDPEKSLDFYQHAFGFKPSPQPLRDGSGKIVHAEMSYRDAYLMMGAEGAMGSTKKTPASSGIECPIGPYLYCDDVDALFKQAVAAGAQSIMEPQEMFWGDRMCSVKDPDGYDWSFATNVADFDPDKVPQM